jgi:hypothetical protein
VPSAVTAGLLDADGIPETRGFVDLHRTQARCSPIGSKISGFDMSMSEHQSELDVTMVGRVLTDGDVAAIAEATAERIAAMVGAPGTFALVDARRLARDLGVSIDYVHAHATELGAMRLGSGPKARIRFRSRPRAPGCRGQGRAVQRQTQEIASVPASDPLVRGRRGRVSKRIQCAGSVASPRRDVCEHADATKGRGSL